MDGVIIALVTFPGLAWKTGIVLATGILLGFLVGISWNTIRKWFLVGIVYVLLEEFIRASYMINFHPENTVAQVTISIAIGLFTAGLWSGGVIGGAYLRTVMERKYPDPKEKSNRIIQNIQERKNSNVDSPTTPIGSSHS